MCIRDRSIGVFIMNKQLRVSNLVYEMLVEVGKKHRPQLKPEVMIEELVEDAYRSVKR